MQSVCYSYWASVGDSVSPHDQSYLVSIFKAVVLSVYRCLEHWGCRWSWMVSAGYGLFWVWWGAIDTLRLCAVWWIIHYCCLVDLFHWNCCIELDRSLDRSTQLLCLSHLAAYSQCTCVDVLYTCHDVCQHVHAAMRPFSFHISQR